MVIWDSHPLALGATPAQVFIDGIPQLDAPHVVSKPETFQDLPKVPNFDREAERAVAFEGLPPLLPERAPADVIVFTNVNSVILPRRGDLAEVYSALGDETGLVVVRNGEITCYGSDAACSLDGLIEDDRVHVVDLQGGEISPGLLTYGSPLGLQEIEAEPSTGDGPVFDPLAGRVSKLVGGDIPVVRAVDALQFAGRDTLSVCHLHKEVLANIPPFTLDLHTALVSQRQSSRQFITVSSVDWAHRFRLARCISWQTAQSSRRLLRCISPSVTLLVDRASARKSQRFATCYWNCPTTPSLTPLNLSGMLLGSVKFSRSIRLCIKFSSGCDSDRGRGP